MPEAEKSMPKQTSRKTTRATSASIRDQIKRVTTELLVKHGFRGTNFRTIAGRLKTTTTNIHYHFGNKSALVDEVVQDYVTDASRRQMLIWLDESASLKEKLRSAAALNYQRYKKFNRGAHTNRPWSLIGRLRLEMDVLTPTAVAALASFTTDVRACVRAAVHAAAEKNELRSDAPLDKLAGLLGSIVDSASVLSQDAKSFESLNQLFEIVEHLIYSAYGSASRGPAPATAAEWPGEGEPGLVGALLRPAGPCGAKGKELA
jgi:TetR/AcrR family transcriptional regulator, transcriptional repressor for nem operon